ncbi:MAG TPA: prephenate/arogenate dehydrogenase [Leptolyngbyaceae cyanobacterium M65_K2018_010]|nr:prephenate/arogenate dehydrogenase [Leptolyngbyaceae cyanobacterium M65_K2018_010]
MHTIAIVGLGLIGGSLGLDLSRLGHTVLGIARRPETVDLALGMGAVQEASTDLRLVKTADLVFICTPLDRVVPLAQELIPHLQEPTILTDVGSVKGSIVRDLEAIWPNFVGGHPMAGKAEAGLAVAEAHLFRGRPYVLTPTERTPKPAQSILANLIQQLEARLYWCSPSDHDQAVAWISHLPVMVSSSLIQACQQEPQPAILALAQTLASSGFRDTSRVGGGSPELGTLMARYNREALLRALTIYQAELASLSHLIEREDWPALHQLLTGTQAARPAYVVPELEWGE